MTKKMLCSAKKGKKLGRSKPVKPKNGDDKPEHAEEGSKHDAEKSKSTVDVHYGSTDDNTENIITPNGDSKKKKMWGSFKKSTKRFRFRGKDRHNKKQSSEDEVDARRVQSSPDVHHISTVSSPDSPLDSPVNNLDNKETDFDDLFSAAEKRQQEQGSIDPGVNGQGNDKKETEIGSEIAMTNGGIAVVESTEATIQKQRQNAFRAHSFFIVDVVLKSGHDLVIRDKTGTSDPYVKIKYNGKQVYKSRTVFKNLNPKWDEKFSLPIDDAFKPFQIKCYDYDRGMNDDPMGAGEIDISTLEMKKSQEVKVMLTEKNKSDYMGYLLFQCTVTPKSQNEKEEYFKRSTKIADTAKKLKMQIWNSVVTIVLVEGKNLLPMDDCGTSDPYVKFRLADEKYKSKIKNKTLNPRWLEQFDMYMYEQKSSTLEIEVLDHDVGGKDDFMGRASVDLSSLDREQTHTIEAQLEDGAGVMKILLTISGTCGNETVSDLSNYIPNPQEREDTVCKYGILNSLKQIKDIGYLQVKVIKAQGLAAADLGGKSDPFCVLELVNARLQTQTEYKTLNPDWGKIFTFNVKDIHSVLEVTVYDEDRDKKAEFLGKIAIPLLKIKNGEKRWYTLKDKKCMARAKGVVLLEMDIIYNHFKAAIRTFNPREEKFMQPEAKFKISVMKRNIDRVSKLIQTAVEGGKFLQSCFDWESKIRSSLAFAVYLIIVWNFELYMLPVTLLIVFILNFFIVQVVGRFAKPKDDDEYVDEEDDDDEDDKEKKAAAAAAKKEEKKSFKEKLHQVQEICLQVQEGMDMAASMGERVQNTFNWTVPWLSVLAVVVLTIGCFVLYNIPIRYLILAWGINKFTKKLRAPNAIPNNELLDYLSRVPSDKELIYYRELRPDPMNITVKKKRQ